MKPHQSRAIFTGSIAPKMHVNNPAMATLVATSEREAWNAAVEAEKRARKQRKLFRRMGK